MSTPEQESQHEEQLDPDSPEIYVASLSDYNTGRLHGRWLRAGRPAVEIAEDITAMLEASIEPGAEEFAIHDFQGFGGWRPGEYESIETVAAVASGIVEHGPSYSHWASFVGAEDSTVASFGEAFLGEHESMLAYAEALADDIGLSIVVEPLSWTHYVKLDVEALARDLDIDLYTADSESGIYVFDPTVL